MFELSSSNDVKKWYSTFFSGFTRIFFFFFFVKFSSSFSILHLFHSFVLVKFFLFPLFNASFKVKFKSLINRIVTMRQDITSTGYEKSFAESLKIKCFFAFEVEVVTELMAAYWRNYEWESKNSRRYFTIKKRKKRVWRKGLQTRDIFCKVKVINPNWNRWGGLGNENLVMLTMEKHSYGSVRSLKMWFI